MCGICGILDTRKTLSKDNRRKTVLDMNAAILHRGPDEFGFFEDNHCTLAMRRLSIIDLSTGRQPIWNEDESIGVFFNGEIYNYRELRADLVQRGHLFRTHSDTETLVHLYEEYGSGMISRLRGMFAFCIYDRSKSPVYPGEGSLWGKTACFYHWDNQVLTFSSEIRFPVLKNKRIPRKLDQEALAYYLQNIVDTRTASRYLKDIKSLPPGFYLELEGKELKASSYFELSYRENAEN